MEKLQCKCPFYAAVCQLLLASCCALGDEPSNVKDTAHVDEALSGTSYITSLLVKREFPVTGATWGAKIFVDAPLNDEPEGAQITLRTAKLKYLDNLDNLGENWKLKLTGVYTEGGGLELSDNYFSYSGWNRTLLILGISDPGYSVEATSDSSGLTFMEQGLPVAALAENKSGGAAVLRRTTNSILSAAVSLVKVSQDDIAEAGEGIVLHYVYSPIKEGAGNSIHLGGSMSYRINAEEGSTQFRTRPEVGTVNDYYVDTGPINGADKISRFSLEASQVLGRFSWQSEWLSAQVRRENAEDVEFSGAYIFASWFLTDDSRNYDFGSGSYDQVQVNSPFPNGGPGAIELAFRTSQVDLTDQDIIGGREKNVSVGLNWYLNQRLRLMSNLVKVLEVDRPGSEYDGQHPLILSLRIQWVLN